MKNFYDELEVSKSASKEVIEKVYKVLAKKYHPDTTKEDNKSEAEEKFKAISVAYETLSDDEKRKKYDLELENSNPTVSYEDYVKIVKERDELIYTLNNLKVSIYNSNNYSNINNNTNTSSYQAKTNYTSQNPNMNSNSNNYNTENYNTKSYNTQRKRYYYTNTGKPASVFDYIKYKVKEFFKNLFILILSIILAVLVIGTFTNFNILNFFL